MADSKISALTEIGEAADPDLFVLVDVDDTTQAASGTTKKISLTALVEAISSRLTPADDARIFLKALAANAPTNSTVTLTKIANLDQALAAGTYYFRYAIRYQAGATGTGVRFNVNFTGTTSTFQFQWMFGDVSATAATAAPDQDQQLATAAVTSIFTSRVKRTTAAGGTTLSVDAANSDMLMIIEGLFICSTSGTLELYHGSEVAAASTVMAGSSLMVLKTG